MTDYTIVSIDDDATPEDALASHVAAVPQDEKTVGLVAELYRRYQAKGIAHRFALHRYSNSREDPHGVLVGFTAAIAVFWRASCGHFWIERDQISFEHEAAFLPGTRAPIIDVPRKGACYRFTKGVLLTLAIPFKPCNAYQAYKEMVRIYAPLPQKASQSDDDGDVGAPPAQTFQPTEDGFTLLGGGKP